MKEKGKYSESIMVICAYKPKEGKDEMLLEIVKNHVPILRRLGLATDKPASIMKAANGTIVEVFEWVSEQAIEDAHKNPEVLEMWKTFDEASEYIPLADLDESKHVFSDFEPID